MDLRVTNAFSWHGLKFGDRDEELANRIVVDPHSPGEFRTNGPLSNMPEFYKAFNVRSGYRLWRPDNERAKVW